jgi:peptidoglycan/xylan/chitin deacetylase (PgdA/CDA1 family)/SAM-dependent methyltransferase
MTSIVIPVGRSGTLPLTRSVDSAARQTLPTTISLAVSASPPPRILESLVSRVGAEVVESKSDAAAINAAVQRATSDLVALLRVPWRLEPGMVERSAQVLTDHPEVAVVVPAVRVQSLDGSTLRPVTCPLTVTGLLAGPMQTPPIFMIRRQAWDIVGGMDESFGALAASEWWLRLLAATVEIARIDGPLGSLTAGPRDWWPSLTDEPLDLVRFRAILERHRELLERNVHDLVVEQEVAFAQLTSVHREALRQRDHHLAELDRLRAEAAHHRAYLDHHGRGGLDWGDLKRADPISRNWGYERGTPIDRYYIEDFLAACSSDVTGTVLEVQESDFTQRFGGSRVIRSEVVDLDDGNPRATIVADLRSAAGVDGGQFDCIILTQTLHVIDDMRAVLGECYRLLTPGGVLLATLPSASRVCLEYGADGDLWRLTTAGARALFEPVFGSPNVATTTYGSVLTNVAFHHGLACEELTDGDFAATDPYHPLLVGVRARKVKSVAHGSDVGRSQSVVLLYHRVADADDVHDLAVPIATFADQLDWLTSHCHVLPLEQLLNEARDGLPERAVAISFDDGYLDTLQCAAPILERAGMAATVFATTRWLEGPGEYWWDVLERALLEAERPPRLTLDMAGVPMSFSLATRAERRAAHDTLHQDLVHATLEVRDRLMSEITSWAGLAADLQRRPVVADELQRLARMPGITIGAHSVNHLALPDQSAPIQQRELVDCARDLERVLGHPVHTFAFPYGAVDRRSAEISRQHYRWSATCEPRSVASCFDAVRVPRVEVKRWDRDTFAGRLERMFSR